MSSGKNLSEDTQPAMAYPTSQQYRQWKTRAGELDMSVSQFIQSMVETGMTVHEGFERDREEDEKMRDLRDQRNDLKNELKHERERVQELEEQLYRDEYKAIVDFVEEHPGVSYAEIGQHVANTVPKRLPRQLDTLEGDAIKVEDGRYYSLAGVEEEES